MTDPKLPPPLPPRPIVAEPFRNVAEEDALRSAITPPERPIPEPTRRELVDALGALRRQLVVHGQKLDDQQPPAGPTVVSIPPSDAPPKSKAVVVAGHTWNVTKTAGNVVNVVVAIGLVVTVVKHPELAETAFTILKALVLH